MWIYSSDNSIDNQLQPSQSQWVTIYFVIGYAVGITLIWQLPYVKELLWPFKMLTVGTLNNKHSMNSVMRSLGC
jgi:hypothetical protein